MAKKRIHSHNYNIRDRAGRTHKVHLKPTKIEGDWWYAVYVDGKWAGNNKSYVAAQKTAFKAARS